MRTLLAIFCVLFLMTINGCAQSEATLEFTWTAVDEDGASPQGYACTAYDLRYAEDSTTLINWDSALVIPIDLVPKPVGETETFTTVLNLESNKTYYFAIKAIDEAGNISPISNIAYATMPDVLAPASIIIQVRF